jgi:transcription elongation factor GreA
MPNQKVVLTAEGKKNLENKIAKTELKIMQLNMSIERVIQLFGLNDEQYLERLQMKKIAEYELSELQDLLSNSELISKQSANSSIEIGCEVVLKSEEQSRTYQIVETYEANPMDGKVSNISPLGKSLLGRRLGEMVKMVSPNGMVSYKIDAIN